MESGNREQETARWTPLFEQMDMPEERRDVALDYILSRMQYGEFYDALTRIPYALLLIKELELDGVHVEIMHQPSVVVMGSDKVLKVLHVSVIEFTHAVLPGKYATERALCLLAREYIGSELALHKSTGLEFVFGIYELPCSVAHEGGRARARFEYVLSYL